MSHIIPRSLSHDVAPAKFLFCFTEGSDEILGRVKRDHARSVREQIYHVLLEWKKMKASEATLNLIIKELEDLNENLLASVYRRKLSHIVYP